MTTLLFSGAATISLSSSASSADKNVIAKLRQTDGYAKVKTNPIRITYVQLKRYAMIYNIIIYIF